MPRRKGGRARIQLRRARRQAPGKFRLHKPRWVDPYPYIPGTEPEKRIFQALMQRGIYFIFQGQIPEFEKGGGEYQMAPVNYKPDFVLPEYKIIIDPFSPFHHSLTEAVERDADKVARYELVGWHYYHPWAIAPGLFTFDQRLIERKPRRVRRFHSGRWFSYTEFFLRRRGEIHSKTFSAQGMLALIPELSASPRHKLTDPQMIKDKRTPGYTLGPNLGLGSKSVGAANRRRRRMPSLKFDLRR